MNWVTSLVLSMQVRLWKTGSKARNPLCGLISLRLKNGNQICFDCAHNLPRELVLTSVVCRHTAIQGGPFHSFKEFIEEKSKPFLTNCWATSVYCVESEYMVRKHVLILMNMMDLTAFILKDSVLYQTKTEWHWNMGCYMKGSIFSYLKS